MIIRYPKYSFGCLIKDFYAKKGNISKKPLTPTMDDYPEAIFIMGREKGVIRVKDSRLSINSGIAGKIIVE